MSFISPSYLDYIGPEKRAELYRTHTRLGYQPETYDELLVPTVDMFAGTYITGVQGAENQVCYKI